MLPSVGHCEQKVISGISNVCFEWAKLIVSPSKICWPCPFVLVMFRMSSCHSDNDIMAKMENNMENNQNGTKITTRQKKTGLNETVYTQFIFSDILLIVNHKF